MGRGLKSFVAGYLMLGIVITLVTETISAMQGSSRVVGLVSSGAAPASITMAVTQDWIIPAVTWPVNVAEFAYRQISAH